jgi:hypothetical protein
MKQKSGSIWECSGCAETGGTNHPLPGTLSHPARRRFQNGVTHIEFLVVATIQN